MPELPEVEAARQFVEQLCGGHTITNVVAVEQGGGPRNGLFDDLVFDDGLSVSNEASIREALLGKTLERVHRKGKQMWFEFRNAGTPAILFHFGMTGSFAVKDHEIAKYKSFRVDEKQWPPRFTKLLLGFSNGKEVSFSDSRRLGRIRIRQNPLESPPISSLATDPITGDIPGAAVIRQALSTISAPIKSVLLDQERLFCGIGNYLADEILYQARIHPATKASALSEAHIASMVAAMRSILQIAVAANADYKDFPRDWLFHVRWDKVKSKTQRILMPDGCAVVFEEIAGRTTAIVPSLQILHRASGNGSNPSDNNTTEVSVRSKQVAATTSSGSTKRKRTASAEGKMESDHSTHVVALGSSLEVAREADARQGGTGGGRKRTRKAVNVKVAAAKRGHGTVEMKMEETVVKEVQSGAASSEMALRRTTRRIHA